MMLDIMCDLETSGIDPTHSHIIQLSAVRFDIHTKQIHDRMFDQCLLPAPGRYWDESTRDWWMGEEKWPIYCQIASRMRPPEDVLREFQDWALEFLPSPYLRLWAKPTSFEFPFISSYFKQYQLHMPFHYRYVVDLNSYVYGRGHTDIDDFWKDVEPVGTTHNALHDVLYQIRGAFQA